MYAKRRRRGPRVLGERRRDARALPAADDLDELVAAVEFVDDDAGPLALVREIEPSTLDIEGSGVVDCESHSLALLLAWAGQHPEQASAAADRYVKEVRGVVVSR